GMKVLVADDDPASRLLLQRVLTRWGYEVVTASDGEEAWQILSAPDAPDLAVLDWMMPGLDGVEICQRIRAMDSVNPPYVILLTSRGDKHDIATGLEAGASDYVQKPFDPDELRARLLVGRRFAELNAKLLDAQRELERQALTDPLTQVMNRRAILGRLEEELPRAAREHKPLSVAILDIDHFKAINDRYGHAAGDYVLQAFVARVQEAVRPYDALGRIGGEEFLLVLPGVGKSELPSLLERVRTVMKAQPVTIPSGEKISVTVSLGGATAAGESMEDLLRAADDALYRAKNEGRDRVVIAR
ncbi:MAG: GGDEF domain-containing response regulator, partial [Anaerolineae bacterium]